MYSMALDCEIPAPVKKDIRRLLVARKKKFERGAQAGNQFSPAFQAISDQYDAIIQDFKNLNVCSISQIRKGKKRKKTPRNVWIGHCMRKPDNGGLGKDMKTCSDMWKSEGEELLAKHNLLGTLEEANKPEPEEAPAEGAEPEKREPLVSPEDKELLEAIESGQV